MQSSVMIKILLGKKRSWEFSLLVYIAPPCAILPPALVWWNKQTGLFVVILNKVLSFKELSHILLGGPIQTCRLLRHQVCFITVSGTSMAPHWPPGASLYRAGCAPAS